MKKAYLILTLAVLFSSPVIAAEPAPGCVAARALRNTMTPPELYKNLAQCLKEDKVEDVAASYGLAETYAQYDVSRVSDQSLRGVKSGLLTDVFTGMDAGSHGSVPNLFNPKINPELRLKTCRLLLDIGPPAYKPQYLYTAHMPPREGDVSAIMIENVDSDFLWLKALDKGIHCPIKGLQLKKKS